MDDAAFYLGLTGTVISGSLAVLRAIEFGIERRDKQREQEAKRLRVSVQIAMHEEGGERTIRAIATNTGNNPIPEPRAVMRGVSTNGVVQQYGMHIHGRADAIETNDCAEFVLSAQGSAFMSQLLRQGGAVSLWVFSRKREILVYRGKDLTIATWGVEYCDPAPEPKSLVERLTAAPNDHAGPH